MEEKMSRFSRVFFLSFAMMCLLLVPGVSHTADWAPKGSIKLQVGFGAGGTTDMLTRLVATQIEKTTGWNMVVENKPGGGGVAMLSGLMHKKPDGQTLGVAVNMPIMMNLAMRGDKLPFKLNSFEYIDTLSKAELAIVAKADAPFNDFEGMLAHIKATGDPIGFDAKPQQMILSAIGKITDTKMKLVSNKSGAEVIQGVLGGHVVAGCCSGEHIKYLKSGDLKLIASMNKERHGYAPDTKTLIESGYNFYLSPMYYIAAPKGLPAEAKAALTKAFTEASQSEEVVNGMLNLVKVGPTNLGSEGTEKMLTDGLKDIVILIEASK
jgi:tripartite-type tricarboxylate transporter receptor subunit TctC